MTKSFEENASMWNIIVKEELDIVDTLPFDDTFQTGIKIEPNEEPSIYFKTDVLDNDSDLNVEPQIKNEPVIESDEESEMIFVSDESNQNLEMNLEDYKKESKLKGLIDIFFIPFNLN